MKSMLSDVHGDFEQTALTVVLGVGVGRRGCEIRRGSLLPATPPQQRPSWNAAWGPATPAGARWAQEALWVLPSVAFPQMQAGTAWALLIASVMRGRLASGGLHTAGIPGRSTPL